MFCAGESIMVDAFVFIDGNNLYHNVKKLGIAAKSIDFEKLRNRVCEHFGVVHKKTIYYNSVPNINDNKDAYHSHMRFLVNLGKIPAFEVKTRKLQHSSTKEVVAEKKNALRNLGLCKGCLDIMESVCFDCVGRIKKREKGVDMLIGIDMINFSTIRKDCGCCILISGDADFVPALDLLKAQGIEIFTASVAPGYSYEIRKHPFWVLDKKILAERCIK
jgi:uncharacterized LabA/DUF88 family protein